MSEPEDAGTFTLETAEGTTVSVQQVLDEIGFDAGSNLLTYRQAAILVMREHGVEQSAIADHLGCSRANVSSIEHSARRNIERARETIDFVELLRAPVRIEIPAGTDLYAVPDLIYDVCDEHDVKVRHGAPELIRMIRDHAPATLHEGRITEGVTVNVSSEGTVRVLT